MNNLELTYTPYTTKLKQPFQTASTTIDSRDGFILVLKSESKSFGIGEAAPLPEFGSETYDETLNALENFNLKLSIDFNSIEESIEDNLRDYNTLPALKCGLELAVLKLISTERKTNIPALLKRSFNTSISVNSVIGLLSSDEAVKVADNHLKKGYKTLKLKAGRSDFNEDIKVIKNIRENSGNNINLRIDVNGKWDNEDAIVNLNRLEEFNIEYVEQPVKDLNSISPLKEKIKTPVAADESIRSFSDAEKIILNKAADYVILKPMMLGGIIPTLKIADFAKDNGIHSIVTSSFEGVIGRIGAVNAAALINNDFAHGLATADYFAEENIPDPFPVKNGKISFNV